MRTVLLILCLAYLGVGCATVKPESIYPNCAQLNEHISKKLKAVIYTRNFDEMSKRWNEIQKLTELAIALKCECTE